MSDIILDRLKFYASKSLHDDRQALREMIQQVALAGLWRAKFFEHAAFYGGTALRVFYGLDRYSEDLDFTLLGLRPNFKLETYLSGVKAELEAVGFKTTVQTTKNNSAIDSAFVKANTMHHLLMIKSPHKTHKDELLTVKIEIDTDPALEFSVEAKALTWPYLFSVTTCDLPSLFAGKLHAILCRRRVMNVKGRDWYDLLWYVARGEKVNARYLRAKLIQSTAWPADKELKVSDVIEMLIKKVEGLDLDAAKNDVQRFIVNPQWLDGWSKANFCLAIEKIEVR